MDGSGEPRVLCRAHMQEYDPRTESGCPVCRGERVEQAADSRRMGALVAGVVAVLAITTFFLRVGGDEPAAPGQQVQRMSAGPFREDIEKLEWILYASISEGRSDAEQIAFLAKKLADDIKNWESRLHMTVYITDIRNFRKWVDERSSGGFDDAALADARREWERVRSKVFEPADWFASW